MSPCQKARDGSALWPHPLITEGSLNVESGEKEQGEGGVQLLFSKGHEVFH